METKQTQAEGLPLSEQQGITLDFTPRTKLRLSAIEEYLEEHRIIVPCPSRPTLIKLIQDETLEGRLIGSLGWVIYEDSFVRWLKSLDEPTEKKEAA